MKNTIITTVCCITLLASCQQTGEIMNPSEELVMSIEASIEKSIKGRYASDNQNGTPDNLKFVPGDKIGVFVEDGAVVEWEKQEGSSWTPVPNQVYWPDKVNEYNFYAFYPYPSEVTGVSKQSVPMPSLANQNGLIEGLSACDFMVATAIDKSFEDNNGLVDFSGETDCFKHVSSLVAITILKNSDLRESTITKISFDGKTGTNLGALTSYSFGSEDENAAISVVESKDQVESADLSISMQEESTDKTLYFILNSGASLSDITFNIAYNTGDKKYDATKVGLGSGTLASGNRYNFKLNITDGLLSLSGGEIHGWGEGENMEDIIINTPQESQTNGID